MKKVGIIYLILAILCSILVVLPDYINNIEINKINKEKANFEEQITIKCFNTKALKEKYKNNITRINSKKEKEIENSIINYNKIINDGFIFSKNRLIIEDVSNKETIDELNEKKKIKKNNLEKYKANIEGIKGLKLDIYYKYIEKYNNYFDTTISNLSYLNDNKNYWNEEDSKIIFTKRVKFNEYKEIVNTLNEDPYSDLINKFEDNIVPRRLFFENLEEIISLKDYIYDYKNTKNKVRTRV